MVLEEFVYIEKKEMVRALEKLNKKRDAHRGKEGFCDDGIKYSCKCEWEGEDCEDYCMHQHR